jgi:hypothetical protein
MKDACKLVPAKTTNYWLYGFGWQGHQFSHASLHGAEDKGCSNEYQLLNDAQDTPSSRWAQYPAAARLSEA